MVDPNDPRNTELVQFKDMVHSLYISGATGFKVKDFFRLNIPQWLHTITLGLYVDKKISHRLGLLQKRHKKEIIVPGPIPLREDEINLGLYVSTESINSVQEEQEKEELETPNDIPTNTGFLKRIRTYQLIRKAQLERPKHVDQYVREERYEPAASRAWMIMMLFKPHRPLNPYRNNRALHAIASPEQCRILVQVSRAANLPYRTNQKTKSGDNVVNPFIEVMFQKRTTRTEAKSGINPQWNELLKLNIVTQEDDFSPESLLESDISTEMIYINVFDEVTIDLIQDERQRAQFSHERRERIWLGSIQIPFCTVWERSRVDGSFPISIPSNLFNYERPSDGFTGQHSPSLLHLFITLDPPLLQPQNLDVKFQTEEEPKLIKYAEQWLQSLPPNRFVMALTQNMSGKTTFVPRFIRPQNAPPNLISVQEVVRFVSIIPYLPNRITFGADCSLWSTTDQILEVGSADGVEHAIMLCNFLLARNVDAKVVLGFDILEGRTGYVIIPKENENISPVTMPRRQSWFRGSSQASIPQICEFQLYHPRTGRLYDVNDIECPLKEVGCIFNAENVKRFYLDLGQHSK